LQAAGIPCAAIHGNKSQPQRTAALDAFRKGQIRILIATDIAARGIDVSGVSHVFNFEMPPVAEQYVHRIGRTARAGADGIAISFVDGEERGYLKQIERLTRIQLDQRPLPEDFNAAKSKLPKPIAKPAAENRGPRRTNDNRQNDQRPERADGDRPRRRFNNRKPSGVGAHKGAVRKTGGR
jgi:ATP-dependent RNA helicase RhlE